MKQYIIFFAIFLFGCSPKRKDYIVDQKAITDIKNAFENWKKTEIQKGRFFAMDSCNLAYYNMKDSLGLESVSGLAVPEDSSELHYNYEDLNYDNKKDALITFTPYECHGGNSTMWVQYQLLVLSQGDRYFVTDNYFEKFKIGPGFFLLDSIATKTVFGTYFEFTHNDKRCCPSIQRPIKIDLDKNTFNYMEK